MHDEDAESLREEVRIMLHIIVYYECWRLLTYMTRNKRTEVKGSVSCSSDLSQTPDISMP